MAFGFTPKFEQALDLNGLNPAHYLVTALEAATRLQWDINYTSKSGFIAFIGGGMFSSMEKFTVIINAETVSLKSENAGSGMYDWGKNKKHVDEFIETFDQMQSTLSDEELEAKVKEVMSPLESQEEDRLTAPPETTEQKFRNFLSLFTPREGYYVTPIIIDLNILVFILMVCSGVSFMQPTTSDLIQWGANLRTLTLSGEWWRLITNTFLHIGILHILLNMYALLYIGILLERYLGKLRFAAAYLFTGILASLTSIYIHPITVSAGASGAIFGMYGVFLAMLTTNIIEKKARVQLLTSIGIFVVLNLMNGVKAGIDNAAHIGGLVSGLVIGYAYYPSLKKSHSPNLCYITTIVLLIATFAVTFVIYHKIPNDIAKYDEKIKDFSKREMIAVEVFKLKDTSKAVLLSALKDKGLANWDQNLKILDEMDKLDLPQTFRDRDVLLRKYCNLRVKSYDLLYKTVAENSKKYQPSIDSCNTQLKALIDTLQGTVK